MKYFKLTQSLKDDYVITSNADIDLPSAPGRGASSFKLGEEMHVSVPNPLEVTLSGLGKGRPRHYIQGAAIVVISDLLLQAFKKAGVDNFQVFPVVLRDEKSNRKWDNYYAFNEIGLIDAISTEHSKYHVLDKRDETKGEFPLLMFYKVVFSAEKLKNGYKMFRLVQSSHDQLYISEDVMKVLMEMCPPEKWGVTYTEVEII
jgi:hypothetical protein